MNLSFLNFDINKMSDSERQFYTYIENNLDLMSKMNLQELTNKLYISKTFVIRFCKKNGLSGFTDLKYIIKNERILKKKRQSQFRNQIEGQIEDFKFLFEFIPISKVKQVVQLLASQRPLYIHGRSLSSISARYLHKVLNTLNRPCILIEDLHLLNSISRTVQQHSLIFICSSSAPYEIYQEVIDNAQKNMAITILLSTNRNCCLKQKVDYFLYSDDKKQSYNQTDVTSRIHMLSFIQLIIDFTSQELMKN